MDQLQPNQLAIYFGVSLPPLAGNSPSVQIITTKDANGTITGATLQLSCPLDLDFVFSSPPDGEPYQVVDGQVALPHDAELFDVAATHTDLFVSFNQQEAFLNVKFPLKDADKRDYGK